MAFSLRGIKLPHRKGTLSTVRVLENPKSVVIPMQMHIGAPATPVVKVGDEVKVGTLIAEGSGFVSAPIHSSVSGKVKSIGDIVSSAGKKIITVEIESDNKNEIDPDIKPPVIETKEDFIEAIKKSGIVGLGGAGFPAFIKYIADNKTDVDELIINGAECEPYITSDSTMMLTRTNDLLFGITEIKKWLGAKKVIIGVEGHNSEVIAHLKNKTADIDYISVAVLKPVYPQGGEKVLIYHTTGKVVPEGELPISVSCVVTNSSTAAVVGSYLKTGLPLVKRLVTVAGGAVNNPMNVAAPVGTRIGELLEFCGGLKAEPDRILLGGPMMGIAVPDTDTPIMKNTNAVLAMTPAETKAPETTPCIRCGACGEICPFGINPAKIARAFSNNNIEALEPLGTNLCMECGCCSYVCPASRPLVQTVRLAKQTLKGGNK
jgi:electron transport complex protein RnfC